MDSGGTPTLGSRPALRYVTSTRNRDGCPATTLSPAGHAETLSRRNQSTLPTGVSPAASTCEGGGANRARRRSGARRETVRERVMKRPVFARRARASARGPWLGAEDQYCESPRR